MALYRNEFCPNCGEPLQVNEEPDRLCTYCGWFGDTSETAKVPPPVDNLMMAVKQAIFLYRDVCRRELMAEAMFEQGIATKEQLKTVYDAAAQCRAALLSIFKQIHRPDDSSFEP
jgi:hypothetical protein